MCCVYIYLCIKTFHILMEIIWNAKFLLCLLNLWEVGAVGVCVQVWWCMHVCWPEVHMWASFFITLFILFHETESLVTWSSLVCRRTCGIHPCLTPVWGYRCMHHAWLLHGSWGPNSGPCSYTVNTLPRQNHPPPQYSYIETDKLL